MIAIPASSIEFVEGGNTVWVHSPDGSTTLRIQTKGTIKVQRCNTSPFHHADMIVKEDITICLGTEAKVN